MWRKVWKSFPVEDVPIGSITNGVHMPTWVAPDMAQLFDRYLGYNWKEDPDCMRIWNNAEAIPDAELWRTHERLRERLVDFVRRRLRKQLLDKGARQKETHGGRRGSGPPGPDHRPSPGGSPPTSGPTCCSWTRTGS